MDKLIQSSNSSKINAQETKTRNPNKLVFCFLLSLCFLLVFSMFGCVQDQSIPSKNNLPNIIPDTNPQKGNDSISNWTSSKTCSNLDYNSAAVISADYCPGTIKPVGLTQDSYKKFSSDMKINSASALSSIAGLDCLERLFIPKAGSQEIDLSPLIKLKNLKCLIIDSGNKADLSPLASLTGMLYISHKGIKITDISAIQKMDSLIGFNADTQSADLTPLKGKTKLRELNLDYTELNTDLSAEADLSPLAELVSLERLFLLHFRAKDFSPIMRLKKLTYVEMSYPANANVTAADCQALFKANPELKGSCTAWSPQEERYVTSRGAK